MKFGLPTERQLQIAQTGYEEFIKDLGRDAAAIIEHVRREHPVPPLLYLDARTQVVMHAEAEESGEQGLYASAADMQGSTL